MTARAARKRRVVNTANAPTARRREAQIDVPATRNHALTR